MQLGRCLPLQLTRAQVYRRLGLKRDAVTAYKQAVATNPLALEGLVALAQLGVGKDEIWGLITTSPAVQEGCLPWLERLVLAHVAPHAQRWLDGAARFGELEQRFFPGSTHCLLHRARLQIEEDMLVDAHTTFTQALEKDENLMEFMDYYAVLLRQKAATAPLNTLAHHLMSLDSSRPEAWIAAALHSDWLGEKERSLTFIDKALHVGPTHVLAYHVKGTLLLSLGRADPAAAVFLQASHLKKDIYAFKGLVDAYLALHKYKEALSTAKVRCFLLTYPPPFPHAIASHPPTYPLPPHRKPCPPCPRTPRPSPSSAASLPSCPKGKKRPSAHFSGRWPLTP